MRIVGWRTVAQPPLLQARAAAINDSAWGRTATALTFRVLGDGRELWKSKPLNEAGSSEPFDVSIVGVDRLELFVDCPGPYDYGHGVWLDPRVVP